MKVTIAFVALVAVAIGAPHEPEVLIVKESPLGNTGLGDYAFGYVLSNGATRDEAAKFIDKTPVVVGSYSWLDPKTHEPIVTKYVADKFGFRAQGSHIPV